MSRRLKYSPEQLAQVIRIVGRGARLSDACAVAGVKRTSFLSRAEVDNDLKARLEQARLAGRKVRRGVPPSIRGLHAVRAASAINGTGIAARGTALAPSTAAPLPSPAAARLQTVPSPSPTPAAAVVPPTVKVQRPLAAVTWDLGVLDGGAVIAAVIGGLTGLAEYWEAQG